MVVAFHSFHPLARAPSVRFASRDFHNVSQFLVDSKRHKQLSPARRTNDVTVESQKRLINSRKSSPHPHAPFGVGSRRQSIAIVRDIIFDTLLSLLIHFLAFIPLYDYEKRVMNDKYVRVYRYFV